MGSCIRQLVGVLLLLLVTSCSGGACGGLTPLPGGFPVEQSIENAAAVRVSRPGLDFLEQSLPSIAAGLLDSPDGTFVIGVPESSFAVEDAFLKFDANGKFCPGGPDAKSVPPRCTAIIDVSKIGFQIDAVKPNLVVVRGLVPLKLDDTPVKLDDPVSLTVHVGYGEGGRCEGETPIVGVKELPVKVSIPIVAEATSPRTGFSKLDVDNAVIDLDAIRSDDVRICGSCAGLNVCNSILNWGFLKDRIVGALRGGIEGQIKSVLRNQLCTKPNASLVPSCPTGTSPDEAKKFCVFDAAKERCVPLLLGTASHAELGGLLRGISPGSAGGLDFGLAAFGQMNPAPGLGADANGDTTNGITLGMVGGALPQPPSACVPQTPVELPSGIPVPDELAPKVADATGTPHVGLALAGRFLDYTLGSVYNSGLLCLNVSTLQFDTLKTGLLAFLIPTIKTLTFEQTDAAAAIVTRPQAPPFVAIGGGTDPVTDPLLTVTVPKLALDFYVWSFGRFVRLFTFTGDLTVPVTLQTGKSANHPSGGIVVALGEMKVANGETSNTDTLVLDDPKILASAVSAVVGTISKQLVGRGLAPIDVSGVLSGFGLRLDVDAIKKLTKNTDDFVGVFATLSKPVTTQMAHRTSHTRAKLLDKRVFRDAMSASTYERSKLPELDLDLSSSLDGDGVAIEYAWWIDDGTRSPWSKAAPVQIKDDQLFLQGRHVLHVSSRIAGEPSTEDVSPADVPYVVDALAPSVKLEASADGLRVVAWDLVSDRDALVVRYRQNDEAPSDWQPLRGLGPLALGDARSIEVEVRDEEGNVGTVRQALRGNGDPTLSAGGCGCSTPGTSEVAPSGIAVAGLAIALGVLRRRRCRPKSDRGALARSSVGAFALAALAAANQGCSCGGEEPAKSGCGADCTQTCLTGLAKGQPGAFLSMARGKDGTVWAAGYNDSLLADGEALLWGDLVVGPYDVSRRAVSWETVDGLPTRTDGTCPAYERSGWRKGETDPGDNVGRWTSLQVSPQGWPIVSYYDDTNKRLKLAVDGDDGWNVLVLDERAGSDIGKYNKMVLVDGKPVIAYMALEPGNGGRTRTRITLARSKTDSPRERSDFVFEDIAVDEEGPCRASSCASGDACVKETGLCTKTVDGCAPACGGGDACVIRNAKPTCVAKPSSIETYPRGIGAFLGLAAGPLGLGLVAYDGYHGNLLGFIDRGQLPWERVLLDGETGSRADGTAIDTGDVGIAASLAIDHRGGWHVSYVSGLDETLRYVAVVDGKPRRPEVVDDGTGADGKRFEDGRHLVGDDATIRIDGDVVTIFYSDSTALGVRRAVGVLKTGKATHDWDLDTVDQEPGKWSAFPTIVAGEREIGVWWRRNLRESRSVEGDVTLLSP